MTPGEPIYLDHNATTPLDPRVLEAMLPHFGAAFGNAASRQHRVGVRAHHAVEKARRQVAQTLGADPREIIWTSGATEANNLAIKGAAAARAYEGKRRIVTVSTEHKAVLDPAFGLQAAGFEVVLLPVDSEGRLDLEQLEEALTDDTLMVSVMHANNETGVVHPIEEIAALTRARRILFHTDATQSVGKLPLDVEAMGIDLLSLSAHKIYGPQGVGALYARRKGPRVRLEAQLEGGGHEGGRRSGTLNLPGIVGLGAALELASAERDREAQRLTELRDGFQAELLALPDTVVNAAAGPRLPGTLNLSFLGCDAESLLRRLPTVCASSSSACTSAARQPSYVLRSMGFDESRVSGSVRFSLGRGTTRAQLDAAVEEIREAVATERREGPLSVC